MAFGPQWPFWLRMGMAVLFIAALWLAARRHGQTVTNAPGALVRLVLWLAIAILPWARFDPICMSAGSRLNIYLPGCDLEWHRAPTAMPHVAYFVLFGGAWMALRLMGFVFVGIYAHHAARRRIPADAPGAA